MREKNWCNLYSDVGIVRREMDLQNKLLIMTKTFVCENVESIIESVKITDCDLGFGVPKAKRLCVRMWKVS